MRHKNRINIDTIRQRFKGDYRYRISHLFILSVTV